ncbi:MAG: hypothetical protein DRN68_05910 [Thaumarchaeota archaeon]|nr:MAG: hypothetical protein DRN68_05910 [Nitrososphaerota archaeon]
MEGFLSFFADPVSWIRMFKHMRLIELFDGIDEMLVVCDDGGVERKAEIRDRRINPEVSWSPNS